MRLPHSSKKGFTLIELLLVILLMGLMATAAFTSYYSSQQEIKFRGAVKDTANIIRELRSYALSNKTITYNNEQIVPKKYGACIQAGDTNKIIIFADIPDKTAGKYDAGEEMKPAYELPTAYKYTTSPSSIETCTLTMFYDPTSARFSTKETLNGKYAYVRIDENDEKGDNIRTSCVAIFQVSGNPEILSENAQTDSSIACQ